MTPTRMPPSVQRARSFLRPAPKTDRGLFDRERVEGRIVEVSQRGFWGALSAVCGLLAQVQSQGEVTAWVATGSSIFFPPDLVYRGVDLAALPVIMAPSPVAGLQAADLLVRSGAFGLVVIDWGGEGIEESDLGRLSRLAEGRRTAVVFLTKKGPLAPSLATQVSLRGAITRTPDGETEWVVTKDKRSGPEFRQRRTFDGPLGLY